jgi:hypothetical protein
MLVLRPSSALGAAAFDRRLVMLNVNGTLSGELYVLQVAGAYHVHTLGLC